MTNNKYEELAARAERGELPAKPGTVRRGAEANADTRRALMEATGAATLQEAVTLAVGRPRVGKETGPSPVVRARVPQPLKDRLEAYVLREQRKESDIVREAVAEYLDAHYVS